MYLINNFKRQSFSLKNFIGRSGKRLGGKWRYGPGIATLRATKEDI